MKHIRVGNKKQYAFCAIDPYTKEAIIHVASTASSNNAKIAIKKVLTTFGEDIQLLNDNGSENFGEVYKYLSENSITQYFARPHTPKDKLYIENLIGKLQQECLDEDDRTEKTVAERQEQIDEWLNIYHFFRPH
jgi:transposase InsO family protein